MILISVVVGALGTVPKHLEKLEIGGQIGTIQNTEKSPGDLRRLAVTQTSVKDHELTLVRKTCKIIIILAKKNLSYLMYMSYIKLFAENEKKNETLIQAITMYSQGRGMEFGIEKFALLTMRRGKKGNT